MNGRTVSIATVALNAANTIALTLESVLAQDYPNIELMVVDGASWDRTHEEIALFKDDIHLLHVEEDGGIFHAMNRAAELASGEMLLFLNAGDMFHSANAISKLLGRAASAADIVYGDHIYSTGRTDTFVSSKPFAVLMDEMARAGPSQEWVARFPAHQATLTRTALLRELRYDPAFRVCADHDFLIRAHSSGAQIQYVDETVAIYAAGGFSAERSDLLKLEWNALNRSVTQYPDKADAFYFGGGSPFDGTGTRLAGDIICGVSAWQPPDPARSIYKRYRAISADGASFLAPQESVRSLVIEGVNIAGKQRLTLMDGGEALARATADEGPFRVVLPLSRPVAPGAVLDLLADAAAPLGDTLAAFALVAFDFVSNTRGRPVRRGDRIFFTSAGADEAGDLLGPGWYGFEAAFTWSRGRSSELNIRVAEPVQTLRLDLQANPAVTAQTIQVTINGADCYAGPVGALELDVGAVLQPGETNTVMLHPNRSARPGADPRDLGVALVSIELD
ncbi:MAG: glycosyltransferase family 2 protein [Pseudomonadota bacterium]